MEILFEIIFQVGAFLLELFGELLLQIVGDIIGEIFSHQIAERTKHRKLLGPAAAAMVYFFFGAILGGVSLWLFPQLFIQTGWRRVVYLVTVPLLSGAMMHGVGIWRRKHDWHVMRIDGFGYGFLFAFGMALMRFSFGK